MQQLRIKLRNCYGIGRLDHEFDFRRHRAFAIYAPNGTMKSSFAGTFKDLSETKTSFDRIFPNRTTLREIQDESGSDLLSTAVLVLPPYDATFESQRTSTLLVNSALRSEYEQLQNGVDSAKTAFINELKLQSKSKQDMEQQIIETHNIANGNIVEFFDKILTEVEQKADASFADVEYDKIFDEQVLRFLATKEFREALDDYLRSYNALLEQSPYFHRGTFDYYNGSVVGKTLGSQGFFRAGHKILLKGDPPHWIESEKELEALIQEEKTRIASDPEVRKKFAELEKQIKKNDSVRQFEDYLSRNERIAPLLVNLDELRRLLIWAYFKSRLASLSSLVELHRSSKERRRQIEEEARRERTQWERVIDVFNRRFIVPFQLAAENREGVILGDPVLALTFSFREGGEVAPVDRENLMRVLSTGERKALYILNILFEIEARIKDGQETVFVVDDIADSFDYKNKYAIIEYLKEISQKSHFYLIILTHNFDFFRSMLSRGVVRYDKCLMALKSGTDIELKGAQGIQNVFVNDWKKDFFVDPKKRIASIPFIRNLIEYSRGNEDPSYLKLTSLLHLKTNSLTITEGELDEMFNTEFRSAGAFSDPGKCVIQSIFDVANECLTVPEGMNFENKIVLSIAVRLHAEAFLVRHLGAQVLDGIDSGQTQALMDLYKADPTATAENLQILQKVALTTPESIHLNSFMYEPIVDMSDLHLRALLAEVQQLR